jgi:hypothetical protein
MKLYETGLLAFPADFSAKDIDKIIGEGRETTKLHYYVRFRDGITHKVILIIPTTFLYSDITSLVIQFLARAFNATYNDFVRDYGTRPSIRCSILLNTSQ